MWGRPDRPGFFWERHGRNREGRRREPRRERDRAGGHRRRTRWRGGTGQWRGRHAGMARAWWAWRGHGGRGAGMARAWRAWRGRRRGHVLWPLATLSPWQAYKPRIKPPTDFNAAAV
eukprot:gene16290-biopygen23260